MSIDKSTMKIFFEGMEGNMLGSGYSSKIISTPMGPFKWNDTIELWENVNNGMVMNNISFQDMMILDYDTLGGGADFIEVPYNNFLGVLTAADGGPLTVADQTYWSKIGGATTNVGQAGVIRINRTITVSMNLVITSGVESITMKYRRNNGSITTYAGPFAVNTRDILRIGGQLAGAGTSSGYIELINDTAGGSIIAKIPFSQAV